MTILCIIHGRSTGREENTTSRILRFSVGIVLSCRTLFRQDGLDKPPNGTALPSEPTLNQNNKTKQMKTQYTTKSKRAHEAAHIAAYITAKRDKRDLLARIESHKASSAWRKGVKQYALELIEAAEVELTRDNLKSVLLNGAATWAEYSYGGCALIYDADIAGRLCSPSEYKRKRQGEAQPSPRETWLDCQARALSQAASLIKSLLA